MVPVLKQGLPISKGKIKCHETYLGVVNTKISFFFVRNNYKFSVLTFINQHKNLD